MTNSRYDSFRQSVVRTLTEVFPALERLGFSPKFRIGLDTLFTPKNPREYREWTTTESRFKKRKGSGMNILVTHEEYLSPLQIIPWTRTHIHAIGNKELLKILRSYPRYHMTREQKLLPEQERMQHCHKFFTEQNLYFLVTVKVHDKLLFSFDRYDSIPLHKWSLSTRGKNRILSSPVKDRMSAKMYQTTPLLNEQQLKAALLKAFQNPNQIIQQPPSKLF